MIADAEVIELNEKYSDQLKMERSSLFSTTDEERETCEWVKLYRKKVRCLHLQVIMLDFELHIFLHTQK